MAQPRVTGRAGVAVGTADADVVIIGSGVAGMSVALACGFERVTLLTKTDGLVGGSTWWAQGGIAAAVGPDDTPERHAADTVAVGHGLVVPAVARILTEEGKRSIDRLIAEGFAADREPDGRLLLSQEAAHSRRRITHAGGDATGRHLAEFLAACVIKAPAVEVAARAFAVDLVRRDGRIVGVIAHHADRGWIFHRTPRVVLATGGVGQVFAQTTNPPECTGDGLALAARAGATLSDLEFVQFHPTALAVEGKDSQKPLLTEALRGDGARLLDEFGRRFMADLHPDAELAPRDVVAHGIWQVIAGGGKVFLDLRPVLSKGGESRFPTVMEICRHAGLDPRRQPIPVAPVAHYHMGGIATDDDGRTDVPGLWACGEAASTGVHGANRLASNSLLEGLVFGARVARDLGRRTAGLPIMAVPAAPGLPVMEEDALEACRRKLKNLLYEGAGLVRDEEGMVTALREVARIDAALRGAPHTPRIPEHRLARAIGELVNGVTVAKGILVAALGRRESRGAHLRSDFPAAVEPAVHQRLTLDDIEHRAAAWCANSAFPFLKAGHS